VDVSMNRMRRFAPLLLALLAVASASEARSARALALTSQMSAAPVGTAPRDVLSAGGHLPDPTYLAPEGISLDPLSERGGSPHRLPPGAARHAEPGAASVRTIAPEHSRVRSLQRLHLDFAAILAASRAGVLSSLNQAHPPPHPA